MFEVDIVECGTCKKPKKRIFTGYFNKRVKRYQDESGSFWNGRKYCGTCNLQRVRKKMGELRDERTAQKIEEGN